MSPKKKNINYWFYVDTRIRPMPKKKYQKKERGPRFAFLTKSEEDYIDDGYKWRKYGQKDLKRSPHPRYILYAINNY